MTPTTTPRKPRKPRTARQHNAEQGVQDVRIVGYDIPAGDGGSGNSGAGGPSPPPAPPRKTGGGRQPLPRWLRLLITLVMVVVCFAIGWQIGKLTKRFEESLEKTDPPREAP
jgi:hypothetical protein